ncbi:hypothetical protein C0J52_21903 [Blattella germanica]|nr:hypothetical protein C0J52_21903 [Blattella germanica]
MDSIDGKLDRLNIIEEQGKSEIDYRDKANLLSICIIANKYSGNLENYDSFVNVDADILIAEHPTDEEIIESVPAQQNDSELVDDMDIAEDEVPQLKPTPSAVELMHYENRLLKLRHLQAEAALGTERHSNKEKLAGEKSEGLQIMEETIKKQARKSSVDFFGILYGIPDCEDIFQLVFQNSPRALLSLLASLSSTPSEHKTSASQQQSLQTADKQLSESSHNDLARNHDYGTMTEHYLLKQRLNSKLTHAERRNERWLLLKDQESEHRNDTSGSSSGSYDKNEAGVSASTASGGGWSDLNNHEVGPNISISIRNIKLGPIFPSHFDEVAEIIQFAVSEILTSSSSDPNKSTSSSFAAGEDDPLADAPPNAAGIFFSPGNLMCSSPNDFI